MKTSTTAQHVDPLDGIPPIIQTALHTQHYTSPLPHKICGLRPFLLPDYLSLRSAELLPECLQKACEEERRCRRDGRGRCKRRRRRRGRDTAKCSQDVENSCESAAAAASFRQGGKRKRKTNAKCEYDNQKEAARMNIAKDEWRYFQIMARVVVAPYTHFLIHKMDDLQSRASSIASAKREVPDTNTDSVKGLDRLAPENVRLATKEGAPGHTVQNVYLKTSNKSNQHKPNNHHIALSPPRESLESLVDGVVCTLVQRNQSMHRPSHFTKSKVATRRNLIHRRRQRNKHCKQALPQRISANKLNKASTNDWLYRSTNILSKGYSIGNAYYYKNTSQLSHRQVMNPTKPQNPMTLRPCPNMAPGIHCLHPNSLTTYARSSKLMRLFHRIVGDEMLSELLLNAIVLIPAVDENQSVDGGVEFERGNYFQLCGPPLNVITKEFERINANVARCDRLAGKKYDDGVDKSLKRKREEGNHGICSEQMSLDREIKKMWSPNRSIPRSKLFYCDFYARQIGLSPKHILNQPLSEDVNVSSQVTAVERKRENEFNNAQTFSMYNSETKLLNSLVHLWPRKGESSTDSSKDVVYNNKRRNRWRRLRETGVGMCRELMRRHKQCDYARLLESNCPLPMEKGYEKKGHVLDAKEELKYMVTLYTPTENVGRFLESVLRSAFPSAFWGSKHNFCQMVKTLKVFIDLRLSESFPEKLMIEGIRILDMKWLHPQKKNQCSTRHSNKRPKLSRTAHESSVVLLRNVMHWVYCKFIIPLLRSVFYVTDTEFTGKRVVYYRRPVWSRIRSLSLEMLMKRQYRERTLAKAKRVLAMVSCPPAPLRLLPKKTGIRAIAMLSKACQIDPIKSLENSSSDQVHNIQAPNKILQSTFQALRYEYKKQPLFGAGALGVTEVFPSYCCFLDILRKRFPKNTPRLYFTSADIEHCYDNINQDHLYRQVRSVLTEDQYVTQNHFILHSKDRNKTIRCRWRKSTRSPSNFLDITSPSKTYAQKFHSSIFIDGVSFSVDKRQTIVGLLKDHIFGQMIVASGSNGQRLLLQRNGIPQGSILSSLFCNAYFGNVESKLLDGVFERDSIVIMGSNTSNYTLLLVESASSLNLLVRIVDDFLLISTDYGTSLRFLNGLNKGVPRLGVKVNHDKTRANYRTISVEGTERDGADPEQNSNSLFAWCGLLIDTTTCEIYLDGDRFSGPLATDNVIVHRSGKEGVALAKKMKDFVKPRCRQQLLFSSFVNRKETIQVNFYQTFMLCTMKTVHYLKSGGSGHTARFHYVYNAACDTIHYSYSLISSTLRDSSSLYANNKELACALSLKEALWLGRHAFYTMMGKESELRQLRGLFRDRRDVAIDNRQELIAAATKALELWPRASSKKPT